jgi:hypothetical protein
MLKELNKARISLQANKNYHYAGMTPLWDEFYVKAQNKKFKNKWDRIKQECK